MMRFVPIVCALLVLAVGESLRAQEPPPATPEAPVQHDPLPRPPSLSLRSTRTEKNGVAAIELEAISPTGEPVELVPLVDGQPASDFVLAKNRNVAKAEQYTLTLPLPARDCVVDIVAKTKTAQSQPVRLRCQRAGLQPETRAKLYVLSVGIGNYLSRDIPKLSYAAKDARDLAAMLSSQRPLLYRNVETRVLLDGEATRQHILDSLVWLEQNVSEKDTATIFLSGHGTNDPEGNYYYLPHEAMTDRQTLLSGTELQRALARIRGKIVLLLDTCHSGNVLGKSSLVRLLNELVIENRLVVFTASTGDQTSRESPAWQNGAFTKAVIEGLRGKADYTEDGTIAMSELETWTGERVKALTASTQTPTLAKPNAAPDYVLAALPQRGVLPNSKQALRRKVLYVTLGLGAGVAVVLTGVLLAHPWTSNSDFIDVGFPR